MELKVREVLEKSMQRGTQAVSGGAPRRQSEATGKTEAEHRFGSPVGWQHLEWYSERGFWPYVKPTLLWLTRYPIDVQEPCLLNNISFLSGCPLGTLPSKG